MYYSQNEYGKWCYIVILKIVTDLLSYNFISTSSCKITAQLFVFEQSRFIFICLSAIIYIFRSEILFGPSTSVRLGLIFLNYTVTKKTHRIGTVNFDFIYFLIRSKVDTWRFHRIQILYNIIILALSTLGTIFKISWRLLIYLSNYLKLSRLEGNIGKMCFRTNPCGVKCLNF